MLSNDRNEHEPRTAISRRCFLLLAAAGAASAALPAGVEARQDLRRPGEPARRLSFLHMHTQERLQVVYRSNGRYDRHALEKINYLLRDHRTGEVRPIDTELLELLYALRKRLGTIQPFQVFSGYRSAQTNRQLRSEGRGVARKSMHLVGKAVDIRVPGRNLAMLRDAALEQQAGGVGYYPRGVGFVHVDVGRVRSW